MNKFMNKFMNKSMNKSILQRWQLTENELTAIVDENPSLRGFILGYIAEYKLRSFLRSNSLVEDLRKPDDHDRSEASQADLIVNYRGYSFKIEVKSLQTNSIKRSEDGIYSGKVQVDASDNRRVILPNGDTLTTTCLLAGEFDLLACNLFQFREQWDFAFALNRNLPRSTYKKYTEAQQQYLLATTVSVTLPVQPPFSTSPFSLLDILIAEKQSN